MIVRQIVRRRQIGAERDLLVVGHDRDRKATGRRARRLNVVEHLVGEIRRGIAQRGDLRLAVIGAGIRLTHRAGDVEHHRDFDIADGFLGLGVGVGAEGIDAEADQVTEDRRHVILRGHRYAAVFLLRALFDHGLDIEIVESTGGEVVFRHGRGIERLIQIGRGERGSVERTLDKRTAFVLADEINRNAANDHQHDQNLQAEDENRSILILREPPHSGARGFDTACQAVLFGFVPHPRPPSPCPMASPPAEKTRKKSPDETA